MAKYFSNLAIGSSICVNALLGGLSREMLSSRCYRQRAVACWWLCWKVIDYWFWLFFREDNHCYNCYWYEQQLFGPSGTRTRVL